MPSFPPQGNPKELPGWNALGAGAEPAQEAEKIGAIETENFVVNAKGCFRVEKSNGADSLRLICKVPVRPVMRVRDRSKDGEPRVSYIFRIFHKDGHDDALIPGSALLGTNLGASLGDMGLVLNAKEREDMGELMVELLKTLCDDLPQTQIPEHLGWNSKKTEFALGYRSYDRRGAGVAVPVFGELKSYCERTEPAGSLDEWKRIANVYNRDDMLWAQAVVASAFASPLMALGHLEKAALLFVTGGKGVGKTTALMMACSVYGDPAKLMFYGRDNIAAHGRKLGLLSNIVAAFDEMTGLTTQEASDFTSFLTQGRGRGDSSEAQWSCLPVACANDSIVRALMSKKNDNAAQMSRLMEIQAGDFNKTRPAKEIKADEAILRGIPENYGHAGHAYVSFVMSRLDKIKQLIALEQDRFQEDCGLNSNYRFWPYMCSRLYVGLAIAKILRLVDYDPGKFRAYLVDLATQAREGTDESDRRRISAGEWLHRYIDANQDNILTVKEPAPKKAEGKAVGAEGYILRLPDKVGHVVGRLEADSGVLALNESMLFGWLRSQGALVTKNDYNVSFVPEINNSDFYKVVFKRSRNRDLFAGTNLSQNHTVDCLVVRSIDRKEENED